MTDVDLTLAPRAVRAKLHEVLCRMPCGGLLAPAPRIDCGYSYQATLGYMSAVADWLDALRERQQQYADEYFWERS